jgi:serine/threonine protein kinase/tetratricopeptide (TPR) repeat protein
MWGSVDTPLGPPAPAAPPQGQGNGATFSAARSLKRELLAELRASWAKGRPTPVQDLLGRWPGNPTADPDVTSLLFEDYLQGGAKQESASDYQERFPEHKDSLASLIRQHDVLRSLGASGSSAGQLRLPDIGDQLFGFSLRHELGRGSFARVFLAEQSDLAGRPVVLKVSGIEGDEPQTLAQLQHTHIVPIHSIHEDARAGLRALCMPYFGGASLSRALEQLWATAPRPTRGQELVAALEAVAAPSAEAARGAGAGEADQTPRVLLHKFSYVQAAAWVVARLAEGLAHAHQRGVLHRDIKPSNILLGADCQPMLLDFNLAENLAADPAHATLGGTIAYMPPEQLRALAARDPALARQVDQRSDIYSLGLVLYEMLAGSSPFEQSASYTPLPVLVEAMALERSRVLPSLRRLRPDVPWGLESIVRRCLSPDVQQRYQKAEELAEDLRRLLQDQPLRHAPELSLVERGRKWARRHPRWTSSGAVTAAAALVPGAVVLALVGVRARLADTGARLATSQAQERRRAYAEGKVRALFLVNTTNELQDHLREGRKRCEEALDLYGFLDRDDWQEPPDWRALAEEERQGLREDTRELLLLAGARVRLDRGDREALRGALGLLDRAEGIVGLPPCRAVWEDRAAYREGLGDRAGAAAARARAATIPAATARDHYLLGMTHARERRYEQAVRHLNEAVRLNPRDYWSWMQRGLCQQERGDPVLAAGDFGTCVGLWPDFAWGYFNRGWALARCGRKREAIDDYSAALERDPGLLAAHLNRGMLHLELEQFGPALADLRRAAEGGRDDAAFHSGLGVALEGLGRHREADEAFGRAAQRAAGMPAGSRSRLLLAYGFAVAKRLPEEAWLAFEQVTPGQPEHPQALYGRAMLAERGGRPQEALTYYNRALEASPEFDQARRYRALLRARQGEFHAAGVDINACLSKGPPSGATLYGAACVAALQARRADPATAGPAARQALEFLRRAFAAGYGQRTAQQDRDLDGIRHLPEFQRLLAQAQGEGAKRD